MSKISDAGKTPRKRPNSKSSTKSSPAKTRRKAPEGRNRNRKKQDGGERSNETRAPKKPDNRRRAHAARTARKDGTSRDERSAEHHGERKKKPGLQKERSRRGTRERHAKPTSNEHPQQKGKRPFYKAKGPEGIAAREAAVVLLHNVMTNRRPFDELLAQADKVQELANLSKADRGFARAIAATALRRHGQLLDVIGQFMEKGIPDRSGPLREILLGAAAQLLFLDSPPHAVLNIAVQQVKRDHNSRRYDKLANAVLRRVAEQGPAIIKQQDAGRLNTPNWLWNSWCKAYDKQTAKYIAEAHLHQAQLDLSVQKDPEYWAKITGGTLLPTGSLRLRHKGRIENIEGFDDGAWWVQDAAAALPAKLLGDIKGKRVADLAAAPGGKTAQMLAMGAKVTALDWSVGRLKRLQENLERLEMEADIVCGDILDWEPEEKFDAILLDAPCSSTGTIRRHPDLPYLKRQSDVAELARIQANLLDKALEFVKPGGTLVYCTCSLQPEEGEQQIAALLKRNKAVKLDTIKPDELFGRADWISEQGTLRTLPHHRPFDKSGHKKAGPGMDGFFAARLNLTT